MNLIQKIKCKLGFHNDQLYPIKIKPVIHSKWKELNDIQLPMYDTWMWKCKYCEKEKVIYK